MTVMATTEEIHAANVRYHDLAAKHYDAKWGIDYGERGSAQVLGKLRKALGVRDLPTFERGLEIGAGTGYFGLNLARAGVVGQYTATDISPGMLDAMKSIGCPPRAPRGLRVLRRRRPPVPRRLVRSRLRPCRAAPSARPAGRDGRAAARAASRRRDRLLRRAVALRGPPGGVAQADGLPGGARLARAGGRPGGGAQRTPRGPGGGSPGGRGGRARLHPGGPHAGRPARRTGGRASARRGACREPVRLDQPRSGGHRRPPARAPPVAPLRLPRLRRAAGRWTARCSSRGCRRPSSTTCWCRRACRAEPQRFRRTAPLRAPPHRRSAARRPLALAAPALERAPAPCSGPPRVPPSPARRPRTAAGGWARPRGR